MRNLKHNISNILSLFTSFSTLICCALPTLLIILGLGAVVASSILTFPFLITLSKNKHWMFLVAFIFIGINFYFLYGRKKKVCPVPTSNIETSCETASRWNKIIFWISVALLLIGFFVAYLALPILRFFNLM